MKISEDDVRYVAQLARLHIAPDAIPHISETLSDILTYIDKLNEVDTTDIPPTSHVESLENVFRDDVVRPSLPGQLALQNAPDRVDSYYRVPKIIE